MNRQSMASLQRCHAQTMSNRRLGISLALILLIAQACRRDGPTAREMAAVAFLGDLVRQENSIYTQTGEYVGLERLKFRDPKRYGYSITFELGHGTFTAEATPIEASANRSFFVDQTGVLRVSKGSEAATKNSSAFGGLRPANPE
jgi:hypothetical protein